MRNLFINAVWLSALIFGGVLAGLTACQMQEPLPLPYAVPSAVINGNTTDPVVTNFSFTLDWVLPDGLLFHDAVYPVDTPENIDAINEALAIWQEYVEMIDPLPGYKASSVADKTTAGIFSSGVLDNTKATLSAKGDMVIPRYWPQGTRGTAMVPVKADWTATLEARVADFQRAVAATERMIAAIEGSPLYDLEDPDTATYPLQELAVAMREHIAYPDPVAFPDTDFRAPGFTGREEFDIDGTTGEGWIDPDKSGPLYEYYFGFIPDNDGTWYADSSATGIFPYD